ncbi:PilZ domain-containing protein [Balnearium lithotrophicum]|uniref:PilZ domain-containing protein n=1 Tax=Balnearium lithotrophicum TaxID=223788 RepID=A0A521EG05_9BACT|nr:PilZ domain-containing protein [Balnearium lithotrophicum]SMO82857.1 PilZ domain-containing protein [Balnearium lithotrophicum]
MSIKEKIVEWLRELIDKNRQVEVLSFYDEVPIRVKVKPLSIENKFVQWEIDPKLRLAVEDTGKIFTQFFDPEYKQKRSLEGNVIYFNNKFLETDMLNISTDPRLSRKILRVKISDSCPVEVFIVNNGRKEKVKAWDISEDGIGLILPKNCVDYNEKINLELIFPFGRIKTQGIVVSKQPFQDGEKVGLFFPNLSPKEKDLIYRYIMKRQKEILKTIRLLTE